jgi:hypothetical protein
LSFPLLGFRRCIGRRRWVLRHGGLSHQLSLGFESDRARRGSRANSRIKPAARDSRAGTGVCPGSSRSCAPRRWLACLLAARHSGSAQDFCRVRVRGSRPNSFWQHRHRRRLALITEPGSSSGTNHAQKISITRSSKRSRSDSHRRVAVHDAGTPSRTALRVDGGPPVYQ